MTTLFTDKIEGGCTFKEFAIACIGNFFRDPELNEDGTVKDFVVDTHHLEGLEEAKKNLAIAKAMTILEATEQAQKQFDEEQERLEKVLAEKGNLSVKYLTLLQQVGAYIPPSKDHDNFKNYMIGQIQIGVEQGLCLERHAERLAEMVKPQTGEEYKTMMIDIYADEAEYHSKQYEEEKKLVEASNRWLKLAYDSLKGV